MLGEAEQIQEKVPEIIKKDIGVGPDDAVGDDNLVKKDEILELV